MSAIIGVLLATYIGISFGVFLRVSSAKKHIRNSFGPSMFAPLYSIYFLLWCIRASMRGKINKNAPNIVVKHLDDVMFIFVVMWVALSQEDKGFKDKYNNDIYTDIKTLYCV